jgi:hypothetical protein
MKGRVGQQPLTRKSFTSQTRLFLSKQRENFGLVGSNLITKASTSVLLGFNSYVCRCTKIWSSESVLGLLLFCLLTSSSGAKLVNTPERSPGKKQQADFISLSFEVVRVMAMAE